MQKTPEPQRPNVLLRKKPVYCLTPPTFFWYANNQSVPLAIGIAVRLPLYPSLAVTANATNENRSHAALAAAAPAFLQKARAVIVHSKDSVYRGAAIPIPPLLGGECCCLITTVLPH